MIGVRDIERNPEASILTNLPSFRYFGVARLGTNMAAFMDKLLLVVEAEKNNRDVIRRGYAKLTAERPNLAVVLNKTRSYVPKLLDSEV